MPLLQRYPTLIKPVAYTGVTFVSPDNTYHVDDLDIMTLRSTDAGVAFYVCTNESGTYYICGSSVGDEVRSYNSIMLSDQIIEDVEKQVYYMFKAQRSPEKQDRLFETGPMVYIAHEMTPLDVYKRQEELILLEV